MPKPRISYLKDGAVKITKKMFMEVISGECVVSIDGSKHLKISIGDAIKLVYVSRLSNTVVKRVCAISSKRRSGE